MNQQEVCRNPPVNADSDPWAFVHWHFRHPTTTAMVVPSRTCGQTSASPVPGTAAVAGGDAVAVASAGSSVRLPRPFARDVKWWVGFSRWL